MRSHRPVSWPRVGTRHLCRPLCSRHEEVLPIVWKRIKWGPVLGRTAVPTLVDENGYFPSILYTLYNQARLEEVEAETRAQIDLALKAGIDVTHLDSHSGALTSDPEYLELFLRIVVPLRQACVTRVEAI